MTMRGGVLSTQVGARHGQVLAFVRQKLADMSRPTIVGRERKDLENLEQRLVEFGGSAYLSHQQWRRLMDLGMIEDTSYKT